MLRTVLLLTMLVILGSVEGMTIPIRDTQLSMNQQGVTWHQNCDAKNPSNQDETKKAAIERAWVGALRMSKSGWTHFSSYTLGFITNGPLAPDEQKDMNNVDPAYVPLFPHNTYQDQTS